MLCGITIFWWTSLLNENICYQKQTRNLSMWFHVDWENWYKSEHDSGRCCLYFCTILLPSPIIVSLSLIKLQLFNSFLIQEHWNGADGYIKKNEIQNSIRLKTAITGVLFVKELFVWGKCELHTLPLWGFLKQKIFTVLGRSNMNQVAVKLLKQEWNSHTTLNSLGLLLLRAS